MLIVISHSPEQTDLASGALDAAMTAAILGVEVKLLLVNRGCDVLHHRNTKDKLQQFLSISDGGIYAYNSSVTELNNKSENMAAPSVIPMDQVTANRLVQQHAKVLSF